MDDNLISFGLDQPVAVPGQLFVKLHETAHLAVTESIPTGPVRRLVGPLPRRFGITGLDQVLGDYSIVSVTRLHPPASPAALSAAHDEALAVTTTYRIQLAPGTDLGEAEERLLSAEEVAEVSQNYYRWAFALPNDVMFGSQWGLVKINCPQAWDRTKGSASVVVAVVDTGVDRDHPDLAANLLPGQDLVDLAGVAPRMGWHFEGDFLTRDAQPDDEVGHGTHVAGTVAAVTDNAAGVAGVTWFCKILPVKVLARMVRNSDGAVTGVGTSADIAAGVRWAADNGAHIINMSLGGPSSTFVERDAVSYAQSRGCLVVAAMGNEGSSIPAYPAAFANVVAVGAIDASERRASFSNTGSHIDLAAPGVNIHSTNWDNSYASMQGTSMAAPHVSGVAALLKSCSPSLTGAQIAEILRDTARTLRDVPSDPDPNDKYGHGLVDAHAALLRACPRIPKLKVVDEGVTLAALDRVKLKIQDEGITLPTLDRPKLKVLDETITAPYLDWVKQLDKDPRTDQLPIGRPRPLPFILATPHHAATLAGGEAPAHSPAAAELEEAIRHQEALLTEMQQGMEAGAMTVAEHRAFEALYLGYASLVAAYQALRGEGAT